jgi:hypothetical protein
MCNESFENDKVFANHIRWKHKKYPKLICKYCQKKIGMHLPLHEKTCKHNPKNIKKCITCGKILIGEQTKFCSHTCSAKHTNKYREYKPSEDKRRKIINCINCGEKIEVDFRASAKMTKCKKCRKKRRQKERTLICEICKLPFLYKSKNTKDRKTCSDTCLRKLYSNNNRINPNCGGDTNYKKFRYKGIYMDSSWEVDMAKLFDDKKVMWIREPRKMTLFWTDLEGRKRRYHPDFFLPKYNLYIDVKNKYLLQKDDYKLKQVIKENKVSLIYGIRETIIEILKSKNIFKI